MKPQSVEACLKARIKCVLQQFFGPLNTLFHCIKRGSVCMCYISSRLRRFWSLEKIVWTCVMGCGCCTLTALSNKTGTNGANETSWSKSSPPSVPLIILLVWSSFRSTSMSPIHKPTLFVSDPLCLPTGFRRKFQALSRDVPQPAAAWTPDVYEKTSH